MEPQSIYQPEGAPEGQTPAPRSRKKLIIMLVALAIVIVAAAVFALVNGKKSGMDKPNTGDTSLYYDREGYDRSKLKADVGDPSAIKLTAKQGAQTLTNDAVVIPACSVLTIDNLKGSGFKLFPNGFGFPVMQNYLSKSGRASFGPNPNTMPLSSDTLSCSYGLVSNKTDLQSVDVVVHQPFTVTEKIVAGYLTQRDYTSQPDVNGYQVFKREPKSETDELSYMLRKDGNNIQLDFSLDDPSKAAELVKTATSNLNQLKSDPKSVSTVSYDSPTFTQKVAHSCDLVDNDDVKLLTGVDASPLTKEFWATAVNIADFSSVSDYKTKTNYIRNQCIRTGNDPEYAGALVGNKNHTIQVLTTSYENDEAASKGLLYLSVGQNNDAKQKGSGIGQEAYVYQKDGQNILAFRQGRIVVELTFDFAKQSGEFADPTTYAQKLSPLGEKIADKLRNF